jgi:ATP-dependent DNA helicase DinG
VRDIIVAVDLETTGLDPQHDRIIEIGAVKFQGDEILGEWHSLVTPGLSIPHFVTQLTGITDQDVHDAPKLTAVLPKLERFIGNAPILGHNVGFDTSFLRNAGTRLTGTLIDTYSIASTMLPNAPRFSLYALSSIYGIPTEGAHRALNDVHMTVALYQALWNDVFALPLHTVAEIVRHGKKMPWDGQYIFEAALKARTGEVAAAPIPVPDDELDLEELFAGKNGSGIQLRPRGKINTIDAEAVVNCIEPGGVVAKNFEGYEYRQQQADMMSAVCRALNEGQHVMVEAPTGVGKSMAYLVPAVHFAVENDDRIVISTNTITLQEQLINKDIPLLQKTLGKAFRAAVLKGRSNYLCPRRLAALRRRGPTSPDEMQILARILVWLTKSQTGDRGELTLRGPAEANVWHRLSAEDEGCTTERCMTQMAGTCPFYRARRAAEGAHLLIVNHSLLLADVATEGHVLPDYKYLIVDEAHHLEDATTNGLSFRTDPYTIIRQLADLGTANSGLLGEVLRSSRGSIPPEYFATLEAFVQMVIEAAAYMTQHVDRFFQLVRRFLEDHVRIARNEYTQQIRILNALRSQPAWGEVQGNWENLSKFTSGIAEAMTQLAVGLRELEDYSIEEYDDLLSGVSAAARHFTQLHERLNEVVVEPDTNFVYWAEFQPDGARMSLHAAPLDVGPLVQRHLWYAKDTIVMTSATMRTDSTFSYIRDRLDADSVDEVVIDSPFDYEANTLLYLVNDIPEPGEQGPYQKMTEQGILSLVRATQGRALILFTSYSQLRQTANAISDVLAREGIVVYDQSGGSSRSQLLEGFVGSEKAVLMGTRSFWEGIDVPGADLSVLVIVRLPFSVPSDPLFAARSELFDNSFTQYAIPETILRFRQGFGRLIRRKTDRGVVAIFDRRIISKQYGRLFLEALPTCSTRQGRMADLPDAAVKWLDQSE